MEETVHSKAEIDLLVACGRKSFGERQAAVVRRMLNRPLDWTFILNEAQRHCVLPFLRANLLAPDNRSRIPAGVAQALDATVRGIAARNLASIAELIRVQQALTEQGVTAIPFKGPAVAHAAYGDHAARAYADLDILVQRRDVEFARDLLFGYGYQPEFQLTPRQERAFLNDECAMRLQHPGLGSAIELHWRLLERNASVEWPVPELIERATAISLGGVTMPSLAIEDLILYLCIHGAKHCWERLEWIACVAEIVERRRRINWPAVVSRARRMGTLRLLKLGLRLAETVYAVTPPQEIASILRGDAGVEDLCRAAIDGLFPARPLTHLEQRAAHYWFLLKSRERLEDRARILFYSAFKSPHPEAAAASSQPAFAGQFLRPFRLVSQYCAVALRRYSGQSE